MRLLSHMVCLGYGVFKFIREMIYSYKKKYISCKKIMTIHGYCGKQNHGSPKTMHDNAIISWFEKTLCVLQQIYFSNYIFP